jgi:toxin FitB
MYLLDTNIVSLLDPARRTKHPLLVDWLERNGAALFLSVMTIAELDAGVLKLQRQGKVRRAQEIAGLVKAIVTDFSERVLPLDIEAARIMAQLSEATHRNTVALPDIMIAATARRHGLVVLTRNLRDFSRIGVAARDPLADLPADA